MSLININILQPTINIVSSLHPYLAIVKVMYDCYSQISDNREQCRSVVERAERVLGAISDELSKMDDSVKEEESMKRNFYTLDQHYCHIRDTLRKLSKMNFLKILLRQDDIKRSLSDAHVRLTDCLQCFQISTQLALRSFQNEYEVARQADASDMQKKMKQLEGNDTAMLEALHINKGEMMEAMLAMQKNISEHVSTTIETKMIKHALSTLQRVSGRSYGGAPPHWVISSYDIEIDDNVPLGEGGCGSVKRGTWNGLPVAVKIMTKETSQEALLREVQIWQHLRHDHVLPFYGASVTSNPPFIVSRILENGNAINYLRSNPGFNRVKLVHEVALGMTYLHHMNIIHGDLKGVNILIDDSGKAVVCDFGLSKVKQHAISRAPSQIGGQSPGTLRFMSPEQMMGKIVKATDVYSYAMLLYEIFTGDVPFYTIPDATFFVLVAQQHTRLTRPTSEKVLARGMSDEMWSLLWDCSDPEDEYRPTFDGVRMRTEQMTKFFVSPKEEDVRDENEITDLFAAMYGAEPVDPRTEAETTAFLPYLARADVKPILPERNPKQPIKYVPLSTTPVTSNGEPDIARMRQSELVKRIRMQVSLQERHFEGQMNKGLNKKTDEEYWRSEYRGNLGMPWVWKPWGIVEVVAEILGKSPDRLIMPMIVPFWAAPPAEFWPETDVSALWCCWDGLFQKLPGSGYETITCLRASDPTLAVGSFDVTWLIYYWIHEGIENLDIHASLLRSGGVMIANVQENNFPDFKTKVEEQGAFKDIQWMCGRYGIAVRK
ncbi:kinase-like protein [Calocera viscosa TUFC12733]|uniref:Kinase-like protein n=1 Tax=Calocera viscosa (strain TUFC12733) TaxID=1330018 RepID=A0A167RMT8_CALVF|nr:kinase-like protein [Calocera viscosa TUFC12733]